MDEARALKILLHESLNFDKPEVYRSKIPGYKKELNLQSVNTKMTKKILAVKKNNEEGMQSIGSASGITSMLSRGYQTTNVKKTSFVLQ